MGRDPVLQTLRPGGLRVGVPRGPQHRHEHLGPDFLPRGPVDHRNRHPRVVHEQLLAAPVLLAHHQVLPAEPLPVVAAEPRVLVSVRMPLLVLLPEQVQGHALAPSGIGLRHRVRTAALRRALEFPVDLGPVRHHAGVDQLTGQRRREQHPLQIGVGQVLGQRPGQSRPFRALHIGSDRGSGNSADTRNLPVTQPLAPLEAENLSDLAHRYTLVGHGVLSDLKERAPYRLSSMRRAAPAGEKPPSQGGSFAMEWVATLPWNGWQLCRGMGGSFRVEWVATLPWNRWQLCRNGMNRLHPLRHHR